MAIVGNIIKTVIDVGGNYLSDEVEPIEEQEKVLRDLLSQAKDTAFGKYYGFETILESSSVVEAYSRIVPIHQYKDMHSKWWSRQEVFPDITWPGKPNFFARTSGTSGKKSKRIPITDAMSLSMRSAGTNLIKEIHKYDLPPETFEKEILMLSSSCNLDENKKGFLEGEISGINIYNFPDWYNLFYRPGKEIAAIDNWDERINRIVGEASGWDIAVIAGIPSWVKMMLEAIIKEHKLKNIHEIWPNLNVFVSGGVAFDPFKKSFDRLTERSLVVLDTYLATEGFIGYSNDPYSNALKLSTDTGIYYEFIPFDSNSFKLDGSLKKAPKVLSISEVEKDKEYALILSTCSGAWRYMIGDTIKFVDVEKMKFVISGRTKFFLNVVGSQLSENKLDKAVKTVASKYDVEINQYSVSCINDNGKYFHQWILACDKELSNTDCANCIDTHLKEVNNNYRVARDKALDGVRVLLLNEKEYVKILEKQKKKGGQVKTPKVVEEDKMQKMIQIANQLSS